MIPPKLLPLFRPYRYKVLYGGRGSGKSWSIAAVLITLCTQAALRVLCVREVQNSIKDSSYQLLCDTIERLGLLDRFEITNEKIVGRTGASRRLTRYPRNRGGC